MKYSFEMALANLKRGKSITRNAWQGKKWIDTHTICGKRDIWVITPKKRTMDVVRLEKLSMEDIMAEDWEVLE